MVCPNCNNEVVEGYSFCPFCGTPLAKQEPKQEAKPERKKPAHREAPKPELESDREMDAVFAPRAPIDGTNPYLADLDEASAPSTLDFVEGNLDVDYQPPSLMDDDELEEDEAEITADLAPWIDQIEAGSISIVENSGGYAGDVKGQHSAPSALDSWESAGEAGGTLDADAAELGADGRDDGAVHGDTGFFDLQAQVHQQQVAIYAGDNSDVELLSSNDALGKVGPKKRAAVQRDTFQVPSNRNELLLYAGIGLALLAVIWLGVSALLPSSGDAPGDEAPIEQVEGEGGEAAEGEGEQPAAPAVEAKAGLGDYSWEELGIIAKEIEACATREEALEVAARYNLVDGERRMLHSTKHVELADNLAVPFAIVDVYHDDKADGSGKAGLTFISTELVSVRAANTEPTNDGGWEASSLKSYLADYAYLVPAELDAVVVEVSKQTNNTGYSTDPACVTSTGARYWAPSFAEVAGAATWSWDSDPANTDNFNAILNGEGTQYARYVEAGVVADAYNESLIYRINGEPVQWWLRSPSPSNSTRFRLVTADGNPSMPGEVTEEHGIVLGFAI